MPLRHAQGDAPEVVAVASEVPEQAGAADAAARLRRAKGRPGAARRRARAVRADEPDHGGEDEHERADADVPVPRRHREVEPLVREGDRRPEQRRKHTGEDRCDGSPVRRMRLSGQGHGFVGLRQRVDEVGRGSECNDQGERGPEAVPGQHQEDDDGDGEGVERTTRLGDVRDRREAGRTAERERAKERSPLAIGRERDGGPERDEEERGGRIRVARRERESAEEERGAGALRRRVQRPDADRCQAGDQEQREQVLRAFRGPPAGEHQEDEPVGERAVCAVPGGAFRARPDDRRELDRRKCRRHCRRLRSGCPSRRAVTGRGPARSAVRRRGRRPGTTK